MNYVSCRVGTCVWRCRQMRAARQKPSCWVAMPEFHTFVQSEFYC